MKRLAALFLTLISASCTLDEPISFKDATMWNDIRPGDRLVLGRDFDHHISDVVRFHPQRPAEREPERPAGKVDPEWQKGLNWTPPPKPKYLPRGTVLVVERMKRHVDMVLIFPAYVCRDTATGKRWKVMRPESEIPSVREYFRSCDVRVVAGGE